MSSEDISKYRYQAGGSLSSSAPTYVARQADTDLYNALRVRKFCNVLNSRQMGKSSLCLRTIARLPPEDYTCVVINLNKIGSRGLTADQWYAGLMMELAKVSGLTTSDVRAWLREREGTGPVQKFTEFIEDVLLKNVKSKVVVFIDEIDSTLSLEFAPDDFFAALRALYDDLRNERLTFTLLGVATPYDFIKDKQGAPFSIGHAIDLTGFTLDESAPALTPGLAAIAANPPIVLQEILNWTGGQPFLTQKVCALVAASNIFIQESEEEEQVRQIVRFGIIADWAAKDVPQHFKTIRDRILLSHEQRTVRMLGMYRDILEKGYIPEDGSAEQMELRLTGLVVRDSSGHLKVYNQIYEAIFTLEWVQKQLDSLRPYAANLATWRASEHRDDSALLTGQELRDVQAWSIKRSLATEDYRFLTASQEKDNQLNLAVERKAKEDAEQATIKLAAAEQQARNIAEVANRKREEVEKDATSRESLASRRVKTGLAMLGMGVVFAFAALWWANSVVTSAKNDSAKIQLEAQKSVDAAKAEVITAKAEATRAKSDAIKAKSDAATAKADFDNVSEKFKVLQPQLNSQKAELKKLKPELVRAKTNLSEAEAARKTSFALKLGTQALQAVSRPYGLQLETGVLLAAESLRREPNRDAYLALTQGLQLLPRPTRVKDLSKGVKGDSWLSPRGDRVLIQEGDKFNIVDAASGVRIGIINPEKPDSQLASFSPDGNFVMTVTADSTVEATSWLQVFHVEDGVAVGHPIRLSGTFLEGALGPQGRTFAAKSGGFMESMKLQFGSFSSDRNMDVTIPLQGFVFGLALSSDGKLLASGGIESNTAQNRPGYKIVTIWDLTINKSVGTLIHNGRISNLTFSPDNTLLATGQGATVFNDSEDRRVGTPVARIWDVYTGLEVAEPMTHRLGIHNLTFSTDGQQLATSDADNAVRIWSRTGRLLKSTHITKPLRNPKFKPIVDMAFVGNDLRVLNHKNERFLPNLDENIRVHDVAVDDYSISLPKDALTLIKNASPIKAISSDGAWVLAGSNNGMTIFARNGINRSVDIPAGVDQVSFSPDGELIVICSHDDKNTWQGTVRQIMVMVIETHTGNVKWHKKILYGVISSAELTVSSNGIVAVGLNLHADSHSPNIYIFNTKNDTERSWTFGKPPPEYSGEHPDGYVRPGVPNWSAGLISISPDGTQLLMKDGIRNTQTGKPIKLPQQITGEMISFDRTGRLLVTRTKAQQDQEEYKIWQIANGKLLGTLHPPNGLTTISFSRDNAYAVIRAGVSIWIYRVKDGAPLAQLGFGSRVMGAVFSPDEKTILATGEHAALRSWLWQPQDLRKLAAPYMTRNLNANERAEYLGNEPYAKLRPDLP